MSRWWNVESCELKHQNIPTTKALCGQGKLWGWREFTRGRLLNWLKLQTFRQMVTLQQQHWHIYIYINNYKYIYICVYIYIYLLLVRHFPFASARVMTSDDRRAWVSEEIMVNDCCGILTSLVISSCTSCYFIHIYIYIVNYIDIWW